VVVLTCLSAQVNRFWHRRYDLFYRFDEGIWLDEGASCSRFEMGLMSLTLIVSDVHSWLVLRDA